MRTSVRLLDSTPLRALRPGETEDERAAEGLGAVDWEAPLHGHLALLHPETRQLDPRLDGMTVEELQARMAVALNVLDGYTFAWRLPADDPEAWGEDGDPDDLAIASIESGELLDGPLLDAVGQELQFMEPAEVASVMRRVLVIPGLPRGLRTGLIRLAGQWGMAPGAQPLGAGGAQPPGPGEAEPAGPGAGRGRGRL